MRKKISWLLALAALAVGLVVVPASPAVATTNCEQAGSLAIGTSSVDWYDGDFMTNQGGVAATMTVYNPSVVDIAGFVWFPMYVSEGRIGTPSAGDYIQVGWGREWGQTGPHLKAVKTVQGGGQTSYDFGTISLGVHRIKFLAQPLYNRWAIYVDDVFEGSVTLWNSFLSGQIWVASERTNSCSAGQMAWSNIWRYSWTNHAWVHNGGYGDTFVVADDSDNHHGHTAYPDSYTVWCNSGHGCDEFA